MEGVVTSHAGHPKTTNMIESSFLTLKTTAVKNIITTQFTHILELFIILVDLPRWMEFVQLSCEHKHSFPFFFYSEHFEDFLNFFGFKNEIVHSVDNDLTARWATVMPEELNLVGKVFFFSIITSAMNTLWNGKMPVSLKKDWLQYLLFEWAICL